MGWDKEKEEEIIRLFNQMNEKGKDKLIELAKDLLDIYKKMED